MRILYGVQGTGNGHLSRARVMAESLKKSDIHVDYMFSGRETDGFFDMAPFGDYQVMRGMTFQTKAGRIDVSKTVSSNFSTSILKDIDSLDLNDYDLVLNDYEPISAWAAKRQGVPSISISHQAAMKHDVPKVGRNWFNDIFVNHFAPVEIALGCHWHHFGFPILPPFVDVGEVKAEYNHKVLVYLPFESPNAIVKFLLRFDDYQFLIYHAEQPSVELPSHIIWHGFDRVGFKQNLASCGGVVCNAGFELVSEALTLGKKILVKPLLGQFEQLSNVAALELLAAADAMKKLDEDSLSRWLKKSSPEPVKYPKVGDNLVKWIEQGDWYEHEALCSDLWSQVKLPVSWR
ncbi:glycosyltransferase [Shewanella sp. OPT22]|nr:glycosyltransferase [Shewanella sp. OPT22]